MLDLHRVTNRGPAQIKIETRDGRLLPLFAGAHIDCEPRRIEIVGKGASAWSIGPVPAAEEQT